MKSRDRFHFGVRSLCRPTDWRFGGGPAAKHLRPPEVTRGDGMGVPDAGRTAAALGVLDDLHIAQAHLKHDVAVQWDGVGA